MVITWQLTLALIIVAFFYIIATLPKLFIVEPFESGANAVKFEDELTSQNIINFVNRYGGH